MRKVLIVSVLACTLQSAFAQFIAINDTGFVTALNTIVPGAMSGNELDITHPEVLNTIYLNVGGYGIMDLSGVEHFVNVTELSCNVNPMTQLPSLPPSLELLNCSQTFITHIDIPIGLGTLLASTCMIESVSIDSPAQLSDLYLANNFLTEVPELPEDLVAFSIANNPINEIVELPATLELLDVRDNPSLTCLPPLPPGLSTLHSVNSGIQCLPNWPAGLNADPDDLGFVPVFCDNFYTNCVESNVFGNTFNDLNNNGLWEAGESSYSYSTILFQPDNYTTGSSINGDFALRVPLGNHTLNAVPGPYQTISTAPHNAVLSDPFMIDSGNTIGLHTQAGIQDLVIDLASSSEPRPGFSQTLMITYSHPGSIPVDGSVHFTFDNMQTWVGSTPAPDVLNGTTASWDFSDLAYGSGGSIQIELHTPVSTVMGTDVPKTASISPLIGDLDPGNNAKTLGDVVVASYDPNDKLLEPSSMSLSEIQNGDRIEYTIRFQNTGTADALLVRLTDTLSSDLEWNTFQFLSSSHPCQWFLQNNILIVVYEDIDLPPSILDEPGSHGFAKFSIKPSDQLLEGATVNNVANIYFDFNEPVITAPAIFTISIPTSIEDLADNQLKIWPNPTNDMLWLQVDEPVSSFELLDLTGKVIRFESAAGNGPYSIDLHTVDAGVYFIRVQTAQGIRTGRFVKR